MWNNLVFFWKVRYNKLCQRSGSLTHFVFRGHRNGNRSESGACYDDFRNTEEGRDT